MGELMHTPGSDSTGPPALYGRMVPPTVREDGIDLRRVVEGAYRRRRTLAITLLVAVVVTIGGALVMPRRYVARTSVLVQPTGQTAGLMDRPGPDPDLVENQVATLREFILSRNFLEPTLIRAGILDPRQPEKEREVLLRTVQRGVTTRPTGANTFEVTFNDVDPVRPVRIVEGVVSAFIDISTRTRGAQTQQAVDFLEGEMNAYRARVERSKNAVKEFQIRNADLLSQAPEATSGRLAGVEDGLVEARMSALDAQMRIAMLRKQLAATPPTIVAETTRVPSPHVVAFQSRLSTAEAEHEALRARYTDEHPEVRAKAREVEGLRRQLETAAAKPTTSGGETTRMNPNYERLKAELLSAEAQFQTAQARTHGFQGIIAPIRQRAKSVPMAQQQYESLLAESRVQEALYNSLVERLEQARLANQLEERQQQAMFQLIDPARIVPGADGTRRLVLVLMGAVVGLVLGLTLSGVQEMTDRRVRSVQELERAVGVPVLATIPLLPEMPHQIMVRRHRRTLLVRSAVALAVVGIMFMLGTRTQAGRNFIRARLHGPTPSQLVVPATQTPTMGNPEAVTPVQGGTR